MNIYVTNCQPYFYIIKHKSSGKLYAGCKYAKNCTPDNFMTENGYQTSSKIVKYIISIEGLDSFEILRIDTYCDGMHVLDYETLFLNSLDCANSPNWLNCHNNAEYSNFTKKQVNCEWCFKTLGWANYKKWHGDNCKLNPNSSNINRTFKKYECIFCGGSFAKHVFGQSHGNFCKNNPNKLNKLPKKFTPKIKDRECVFCQNLFDGQNIKQHQNNCIKNENSKKYKNSIKPKVSRKGINWFYNESLDAYKTSLNITEEDLNNGWVKSNPPVSKK